MVILKFFSFYREKMGQVQLERDIDSQTDIKSFLNELSGEFPALKEIMEDKDLTVAVDREVGDLGTVIDNSAEIALFPPVSGG